MSHRFRFEQWVPVPLADVFRFFSDPANLPRIMPPELDARLVGVSAVPPPAPAPPRTDAPDGPAAAGVGSEIVVSVRLVPFLPVRVLWVARITEFQANHHFADIQAKGPFRRWEHRHEFEAAARDGREGTLVRDVLEYEIGFGALGRVAQRLFVGGQMKRTFEHRQRTLERLLGVT
jgi:ligand-binding SRPBCC domain-containing protein